MGVFSTNISTLNYYAAWLHGLSFIVILALFVTMSGPVNFNTELFKLEIQFLSDSGKQMTLRSKKATSISTTVLQTCILLMFGLTCLVHIFYYTDAFKTGLYTRELKKGRNRFRWIEYGITSTIMIFVTAIISGVKSSDTVFAICTSNLVLMAFGYLIEMTPSIEGKIVALLTGMFSLSSIWYMILSNFYNRISETEDLEKVNPDGSVQTIEIPSWIKQVITPLFIWYLLFGIIALLYIRKYRKSRNEGVEFDFKVYERYYIILSYLSKAFMGYYLAFGLTRPEPDEEDKGDWKRKSN